jgi:CBS domain-containing protein
VQEFTDFLAKQPPFDALATNDIELLASKVEVEYFGAGTVIVTAGSTPLDHIYIVEPVLLRYLIAGMS